MKIMVLAMGRTGHHAVIQWIAEGIGGMVSLENNCLNGWKTKQLLANKKTLYTCRRLSKGLSYDNTIKNIEDLYLPFWDKMKDWEEFDRVICVVRSPRNWLASSIAAGGWALRYLDEPPKNEDRLPVTRIEAFKVYWEKYKYSDLDIVYDEFVDNEKYRELMAVRYGISCTPLPAHCKFSSFGKNRNYTGNRYELLNDKQKEIFNRLYDGELKNIQEMYFGKS